MYYKVFIITIFFIQLILGIGDWGLGIGDWAQSPIPNPQSPIFRLNFVLNEIYLTIFIYCNN